MPLGRLTDDRVSAYERFVGHLTRPELEGFFVVSPDRLGRSLEDLIAIVVQLKRQQSAFQSMHEKLDTTAPSGMFIFRPATAPPHAPDSGAGQGREVRRFTRRSRTAARYGRAQR
ncbi:recombinase family protein [Micromonospora sp. NPDC050417]|uniref:recombinase family protein n=1 Tax=Micromonospora sp. NPDC050417 TaxID=3364280 RepID=UPI0037B3B0C3